MPDPLTSLGFIVTVFSLIYAIYQGIKSKQLKKLIHSQTWDLYARANNTTGAVQAAFTKFKEKYNENLDTDVLEVFSKSAAFAQDLFLDTIRHIYLSEPFDYEMVQEWVKVGKCDEIHKERFKQIANLGQKKQGIIKWFKKLVF
jgi:hypothetical protein